MKNYRKYLTALSAICLALIIGAFNQGPEEKLPIDPKVEKFTLPPGFVIEHVYSPSENKQGSWVSMTFDDKGRMIVSDHYGAIYRLEIPAIGSGSTKPKIEKLTIGDNKLNMGYAQGLVWAHNSLYALVSNESFHDVKTGLYRLQDINNDDQFDKLTQLIALDGDGEHGAHSVILGPDKESIYLILGNYINVAKMDHYRLPATWQEDNLLQLIKDPQGHATDRKAPGGWIAKTDSIGSKFELVSAGLRNAFDIAFNQDGELFTYDADMEWDFGMPWYRPTRVVHVTSGSEFGWRTGNSKWSPNYPDNLPAVVNIGQGSPTNLVYAGAAKFPDKYRNSLLAFDWSFGIIYSIGLEQEGASYKSHTEEFISAPALPLTDGLIGPDGSLYFLTGGRTLQSDLYRVYYKNQDEIKTGKISKPKETKEFKIRKRLEKFHDANAPTTAAIKTAWPYLKHYDRHIRYAARIAIEHQPVDSWKERAWKENNIDAATQAMIAMARMESNISGTKILEKLMSLDIKTIPEEKQLNFFRAVELTLARKGNPEPTIKNQLINYLDVLYPAKSNSMNRELSKLLVHLGSPKVVEKTLSLLYDAKDDASYQSTVTSSADLILRNPGYGFDIANVLSKTPPSQQIYYATVLSKAEVGWTPEMHEKYFKWFNDAFGYKGGNSYVGFIDRARKLALSKLPKDQFDHFNELSGNSLLNQSGTSLAGPLEGPKGPGRGWTMEEAVPVVENDSTKRDFAQGAMLYSSILCSSCHSIKGEGGSFGPELTQLGNRFAVKDMLESIIKPSAAISDQYAAKTFYLKDGSSVLGRLTNDDEVNYYISQNPYAPQVLKEVPKKNVLEIKISTSSIMPAGTINSLNEEELKDLIAYLMAGGDENHNVYKADGKK